MPHATTMCENITSFLNLHKEQLKSSGIPEIYWKSLFHKLKMEKYDAGKFFLMQQVEYEDSDLEEDEAVGSDDGGADDDARMDGVETGGGGAAVGPQMGDTGALLEGDVISWQVVCKENISSTDPTQVYLIDHAWTFRVDQVRRQLAEVPGLLQRMASLMDIPQEEDRKVDLVEAIVHSIWRFNQTYSIGNAQLGEESASPIWYIMDEFGSRVQHSDQPTVRMVPFYYAPTQLSYTVMWPVVDLKEGDELTRDYVPGITDMLTKKLRLLPWFPEDMTHLSFDLHEPEESFFRKYRVHETLPNLEMEFVDLPRDRNIRVYTDIDQIADNLTDNRFELVDNTQDADVVWTSQSLKDFRALSENSRGCMVNQFPFEMVITIKNLLAAVSRRKAVGKHIDHDTLETSPDWLPVTFNLTSELSQFVSYFQHREERGLQNHWICKPWNLARGLDTHITNNLDYVLRLPDTGPKIASLYIDDPVLIERENIGHVKFDLRFIVLLISMEPLTLCVCDKFLIRYANVPFSMDHFDEYEKHFTVMNYKKGAEMKEEFCDDFIDDFESQYPGFSWADQRSAIHRVIQEVFEAALSKPPPMGIGHSPQSRAMYGFDFMLKWKMDDQGVRQMAPVVLECNYGPDNTRLCRYYPNFINDVFSVLFLNDGEGREVMLL